MVRHEGPSRVDVRTLQRSKGQIPELFLRGVGASDKFIAYAYSLRTSPAQYCSCFISYSSKDEVFARQLSADLQANNVYCWFAPHDLRPGTIILSGIDEAIGLYDKLLLILSEHSVASNWVEHEVEVALFKEMDRKKQDVLFPIRLDNTALKSPTQWATRLLYRHIGDFTYWQNHDDYQKAFNRLLSDLKTES